MRMTRIAGLALAAMVLPAAVSAQEDFEGTIRYQMTMSGMSMEMTQHVKGKKLRQDMDMGMGAMSTVIDFEAGTLTMMMPGGGVQTMSMSDLQAMAGVSDEDMDIEVTATGQTETVAGHQCEHFIVKQTQGEADICAAKGLGFVMASMGASSASMKAWEELRARFNEGFLPLKVTMNTEQGQATMQALSVERKSLSDDLFKIGN